jgi:hypothetical protein
MLTLKQLKNMPANTVFATGVANDTPDGLYANGTGQELRWVAVRGDIYDWTIYYHFSYNDINWIKRNGDKLFGKELIKKLVECDDEAFRLYRY